LQPESMSTAASVITAMAAFCQWRGGVIVSRITYDYLESHMNAARVPKCMLH
jgi:hypothetical protein